MALPSDATLAVTETVDACVVLAPISAAALRATGRRDTGVMAAAGGGYVFPVTRHNGVCRWFPGLRSPVRKRKVRL